MFKEPGPPITEPAADEHERHQELAPELIDRVGRKYWSAWGLTRAIIKRDAPEYGSIANLYLTAKLFWQALYAPESLNPSDLELLAERHRSVLTESIEWEPDSIPDQDAFVESVRDAAVNTVDMEAAYFPGATEALEEMLEHGVVCIWTTGDMYGVKSEKLDLPGSFEQGLRLYRGSWLRLREQHPSMHGVASERKGELIPEMLELFSKEGVGPVAVIDDKIPNLLSARKKILEDNPERKVILVWDRQCEHSAAADSGHSNPKLPEGFSGTPEEAAKWYGLAMVEDISEVVPAILAEVGEEGGLIGFVVDHDDVISDDKLRKLLQTDEIVRRLAAAGYLNPQQKNQQGPE